MATVNLPNVVDGMSTDELIMVVSKMKKTLDWLLMNLDLNNMPSVDKVIGDIEGNYSMISQDIEGITLQVGNVMGDVASLQVQATSIQSTVTNHSGEITTIKQTATGIQTQVSNQAGQISTLTQTANSLSSQVIGLDDEINGRYGLWSEITQLGDSITSKVSYTDYNGREIASLINQEAHRITISAEAIDLTGVTSIHGDNRSIATFDRYGDFYIEHNYDTVFCIYNGLDYVDFKSLNGAFLRVAGTTRRTAPQGTWDFSNATVIGL